MLLCCMPLELPLITRSSLAHDFAALGVEPGRVLMLHASLKSVGWIVGGPDVILQVLVDVLGPDGTCATRAAGQSAPWPQSLPTRTSASTFPPRRASTPWHRPSARASWPRFGASKKDDVWQGASVRSLARRCKYLHPRLSGRRRSRFTQMILLFCRRAKLECTRTWCSKITGKEMRNTELKQFAELSESLLNHLVTLEASIFEKPLTSDIFSAELGGKKNLLVLVAFQDTQPCGYKIGFEYSSNTFFSWSGGVLPDCRKCGLGGALIAKQHQVAKELGYSYVRTHTKNKYREMLILNIKSGFEVTGIYKSIQEAHQGIILEKAL